MRRFSSYGPVKMKKLPVGTSDFKKLIEYDKYFVDKSLLIKEIIEDEAEILLLPRPRRFGKTLNLTMLNCFFEIAEDKEEKKTLFSGLNIEKEDVFKEYFAKYPVIYLTFKDIRSLNFKSFSSKIKILISNEFRNHLYLLESHVLNDFDKQLFKNIAFMESELEFYENSLIELSKYLHKYHKQKVVILIDEYDTPIHSAFHYGYYDECISFFKGFLGGGLKDNPDIFKGVITGILRIAKESIFSGLNNLGVFTLLSDKFSDKFGLTQGEVDRLLKDSSNEDQAKDIRAWYDGYIFGENKVYNPWSIMNYLANIKDGFKPYWANTASDEILRELFKESPDSMKQEFSYLLNDIQITKKLDDNIVLRDLRKNETSIYSFLLFSGYLTAFDKQGQGKNTFYKLLLPNLEVKEIFEDIILKWINESFENRDMQIMLKALVTGDIKLFEKILSKFVLETLSYFDTQKKNVEKVYQAFILGMLVTLSGKYEVESEKESGYGRYDISIIPKDKSKKAIIMELKTIDEFENETKEQALKSAVKQINERQYETAILKRGIKDILKLGVIFDGKRVWAKEG
jgi:hypothetical protein